MMRSLYSGVAGLKTHQVKMDVIGNNIANVNTVAYKSQSITFSELMYQTTQSASGPNETTGTAGTNAKQIGLGVQSAAISTAITQQGSTQTTGNAFDLRITGNSFFVVSDGTSNYFTRDGSFYVDAVGNLAMSSNGYNVMGWLVNDEGEIVQDNVKKLQIMSPENLTSDPKATELATMTGIIDKLDSQVLGDGKVINLAFYDNMGYSYTARFRMNGTDEEGNYILNLKDVLDANNESILDKFDAKVYTGSNASGANSYGTKAASYSLLDGYDMENPSNGEIKYKDSKWSPSQEITLSPNNIFNNYDPSTGKISDGDATYNGLSYPDPKDPTKTINYTKADAAKAYAEAFGFDNYEDFLSLTVQVNDTTSNPITIGSLLKSGTYSYTDSDGSTNVPLFAADGTLSTDGYVTPAGSAISVRYNQATGTLTGLNGSTNISAFNLTIEPKESSTENPFAKAIKIDMSATKNLNNEGTSTAAATSGDADGKGTGCALGTMTGVSIQNNGMIYGAYDNGQTKLLGQIAVASFSNAAGLEKQGDNLYSATLNSGEFDGIGVDITADGGYMSTGVLEMSNVDLSSEFTELITTQRGFQANSRIITVSDTLLEELVNLKR
ncbi:MAG: flagellar hook-basal body complex protein [Lachnospiraceae bacterium]|nr:flagellar hook-basal body complex protein [Lachnospiraceae bacterium]